MAKLTQTQRERREQLTSAVSTAKAAYNAAWREEPTAKGYPKVDAALDRLTSAEKELKAFDDYVAAGRPGVPEPA